MTDAYETYTVTRDGITYRVDKHYDENHGRPWDENDGHGVTVDDPDWDPCDPENYRHWTDDPENGEIPLEDDVRAKMMRPLGRTRQHGSRLHRYYYDVWETLKIAKANGWRSLTWEAEHPDATPEEKLQAAVDADFEYLQGWCNDDWHWCGITVTEIVPDTDNGNDLFGIMADGLSESLWGLESNEEAYHAEVVDELIHEVQATKKRLLTQARPTHAGVAKGRPDQLNGEPRWI